VFTTGARGTTGTTGAAGIVGAIGATGIWFACGVVVVVMTGAVQAGRRTRRMRAAGFTEAIPEQVAVVMGISFRNRRRL